MKSPSTSGTLLTEALGRLFHEQVPQFASPFWLRPPRRNPSTKASPRRLQFDAPRAAGEDLDPLPHVAERGYGANLPTHLISPPKGPPDHQCPAESGASRFPLVQFSIHTRNGSIRPGMGFAPSFIRFCRLIDVSMNGVALLTAHPLGVGAEIDLWISDPGARPHLELRGTVLRCEPQADEEGFRVVCRLTRFLSFPEIHRIGRTLFDASIV